MAKEIIMWALGLVAAVGMGIGGWFGTTVTGLLKAMLNELRQITHINVQHGERLHHLEETKKDHEQRIRNLENEN